MEHLQERERPRDLQDGIERHVWAEQTYIDGAGSIIRVKGTDTEDEECAVLNIGGVSFHLPKDTNTEVVLLSSGSDTNLKLAVLTIPRDKQRQWKENTGGVQHPTNPNMALEFNDKRAHIVNAAFAVGAGIIDIVDGRVTIRGDLVVSGETTVNKRVITPTVDAGTAVIPPFDA